MTKKISTLILIFVFYYSNAQKETWYYHVNSKEGLFLRQKPSSQSKTLKKLSYGTTVTFVRDSKKETCRKEAIFDYKLNDTLRSTWCYIQTLDSVFGYLYTAYLDENMWYNVASENGLFLREKPNSNSKSLKKLEAGNLVQLINKVPSEDVTLNKNWFKVYESQGSIGYVYSPYLLPRNSNNVASYCGFNHEETSKVKFDYGELLFYNYCTGEDGRTSKDTIYLTDGLFQVPSDQMLQVRTSKDIDSVKVSFKTNGDIVEQFNYNIHKSWEDWENGLIQITPKIDYEILEGVNGFYRIPDFSYDQVKNMTEKDRKKLNLRDTLVNMSGETQNIASIIYKNVPCTDYVYGCTFQLDLFKNGEKIIRYVDITFTPGC